MEGPSMPATPKGAAEVVGRRLGGGKKEVAPPRLPHEHGCFADFGCHLFHQTETFCTAKSDAHSDNEARRTVEKVATADTKGSLSTELL